jgi:hypothetical protein
MPDPIYAALAPMLDGAHDVEAIFDGLCEVYPAEQVFGPRPSEDDRLPAEGVGAGRPSPRHSGKTPVWLPPWRGRASPARASAMPFGDVEIESLTATLGENGISWGSTVMSLSR